jgi:hypothetical protein
VVLKDRWSVTAWQPRRQDDALSGLAWQGGAGRPAVGSGIRDLAIPGAAHPVDISATATILMMQQWA